MPAGFRLRASGFGWLLAVALGARALAQAPEQMRFEVASVKLHIDDGNMRAGIEENEGLVRIANLPLRTVIALAYGATSARSCRSCFAISWPTSSSWSRDGR